MPRASFGAAMDRDCCSTLRVAKIVMQREPFIVERLS